MEATPLRRAQSLYSLHHGNSEKQQSLRQDGGEGRPCLSNRRLRLHLPRLSRIAAAHPALGRAPRRRGARLLRHVVEAAPRDRRARSADPSRRHLRPVRAHVPQRVILRLQGKPVDAARRPHSAISADPRRSPCLQRRLHREARLRGRRSDRDLRARGSGGRSRGDHRVIRQGPYAARAAGRADVRHDEEQDDRRGRGDRALRRTAVQGGRGAGADRQFDRQRAGRTGHRS